MINGINGVQPPSASKPIEPAGAVPPKAAPVESAGISDVVEISQAARLAELVHQLPEIRAELVQRVKAELAAGTYETPERLEIALNNLMDELLGEMI